MIGFGDSTTCGSPFVAQIGEASFSIDLQVSCLACGPSPVPTVVTTHFASIPTTTTSSAINVPIRATSRELQVVRSKRGVPYNIPTLLNLFIGSEVSWAYNWRSKNNTIPAGIEYIPMLWGDNATYTKDWQKNANDSINSGASALLAFNEPDQVGQALINPSDAAISYRTFMSDMFGGGSIKLGSPAVTNGPAPMGLNWLDKFMAACSDCQVDFVVSFRFLTLNDATKETCRAFIGTTQQRMSTILSNILWVRITKRARTSG
jgi:hypothetical protein